MDFITLLLASLLGLLAIAAPVQVVDGITNSTVLEKRQTTSLLVGHLCGGRWGYATGGSYMLYQMDMLVDRTDPAATLCVGPGPGTCKYMMGDLWFRCLHDTSLQMCNDKDHEVCLPFREVKHRLYAGLEECPPLEASPDDNKAMQAFFDDGTNFIISECES